MNGILPWLNLNEPKKDRFEQGYRSLSLLWRRYTRMVSSSIMGCVKSSV